MKDVANDLNRDQRNRIAVVRILEIADGMDEAHYL